MKKHRSGTEPQEVPFPGDSGFMVTNKHPFVNVREERARGDQAYPACHVYDAPQGQEVLLTSWKVLYCGLTALGES